MYTLTQSEEWIFKTRKHVSPRHTQIYLFFSGNAVMNRVRFGNLLSLFVLWLVRISFTSVEYVLFLPGVN